VRVMSDVYSSYSPSNSSKVGVLRDRENYQTFSKFPSPPPHPTLKHLYFIVFDISPALLSFPCFPTFSFFRHYFLLFPPFSPHFTNPFLHRPIISPFLSPLSISQSAPSFLSSPYFPFPFFNIFLLLLLHSPQAPHLQYLTQSPFPSLYPPPPMGISTIGIILADQR
jgi:hypothetical protein